MAVASVVPQEAITGCPPAAKDVAWRRGLRDALPIALALVPAGIALGAYVGASSLDTRTGWLAGALVYGASAHAAAVGLLAAGAPGLAVILAVVALGARGVIYSAGLVSRMQDQPAWFRWAGPYLLVDPLYVLVTGGTREDVAPPAMRAYYLVAGAAIWVLWMAAITAGIMLGPVLPPNAGLAFAVTALQLGFLAPGLRSGEAWAAAGAGALCGVLMADAPGGLAVFAGTAAGTGLGMLLERDER